MKAIYKTQFGFHIDLSKIIAISEMKFGMGACSKRCMHFNIDLALSDKGKYVQVDSEMGLDYDFNNDDGNGYRTYFFKQDGTKAKPIEYMHSLSDAELNELRFVIRCTEMWNDLFNAWTRYNES